MEKQNEDIIKAIAAQKFSENNQFGQSMAHLLFPKNKRALLCINRHYILLLPGEVDATVDIKTLIELLSYLRCMEDEHVIYVQQAESQYADCLLYEDCNDMKKVATLQGYNLDNGYKLKKEQGGYYVYTNDGKKVFSQNVNIDFMADEIKHYLESRIFPTSAINHFIGHKFRTDNDYNNQQALKTSRWSIRVAIFIACLSPLVTLWLSNKWGKATINESQYDGLLMKIDEKTTPVDATSSMFHDTIINKFKNEQNSVKPLQGKQ